MIKIAPYEEVNPLAVLDLNRCVRDAGLHFSAAGTTRHRGAGRLSVITPHPPNCTRMLAPRITG